MTANGVREAAWVLGFGTPSDFVRAYPVSREWLTLLIRRMDSVAAVYRLASSLSPGVDGLRPYVEFCEDLGGVFGVVAQYAADAAYGGPHGANVGVEPPDPPQQMLVGQHPPGVCQRLGEHPVLNCHQFDRTTCKCHRAVGSVSV